MTNKITYLDDGEFCIIKKDKVEFYNTDGLVINKKVLELSKEDLNINKGDFKHFMAKEIAEQPNTISACIKEYINKLNNELNIFNFPWKKEDFNKIILIGCGTAYHACVIAKYWLEKLTNLEVDVDIASEFRYRNNRFKKQNLYIFVSQSGETADTYAALDLCNKTQNENLRCSKCSRKLYCKRRTICITYTLWTRSWSCLYQGFFRPNVSFVFDYLKNFKN